jgi:uncharacterized membrane protein YidH (DUF202 family)
MGTPIGSGKFARNVGMTFIAAGIGVVALDYLRVPLRPVYLLGAWLVACGLIAIRWGTRRIQVAMASDKYRDDPTIGQQTINMLVGMVAATFVIAALVFK